MTDFLLNEHPLSNYSPHPLKHTELEQLQYRNKSQGYYRFGAIVETVTFLPGRGGGAVLEIQLWALCLLN